MHMSLHVTLLFLNVLNVLLHGTGLHLLTYQLKNGKKSPQKIFIINLSACELVMNLLEFVRRVLELTTTSMVVRELLFIIMFTGVSLVFYVVMIYITLDRLLSILLHFKYRLYCTQTKAMYVIVSTWLVGITMSVCISLAHHFTRLPWKPFFFKYFYPTLEIGFIVLAFVTYGLIFKQYRKSVNIPARRTTRRMRIRSQKNRANLQQNRNRNIGAGTTATAAAAENNRKVENRNRRISRNPPNRNTQSRIQKRLNQKRMLNEPPAAQNRLPKVSRPESALQVFRMSRFFVSVLLITSFIIFMLIPDLVYLFYGILGNNESKTLLACCWISYAVSNLLDGWIYIFMQSSVKALLKKKLTRLINCRKFMCTVQESMQMSILSISSCSGSSSSASRPFTRTDMLNDARESFEECDLV